jgi:hypothetical protein
MRAGRARVLGAVLVALARDPNVWADRCLDGLLRSLLCVPGCVAGVLLKLLEKLALRFRSGAVCGFVSTVLEDARKVRHVSVVAQQAPVVVMPVLEAVVVLERVVMPVPESAVVLESVVLVEPMMVPVFEALMVLEPVMAPAPTVLIAVVRVGRVSVPVVVMCLRIGGGSAGEKGASN